LSLRPPRLQGPGALIRFLREVDYAVALPDPNFKFEGAERPLGCSLFVNGF
jgi:hypothetical protein